MLGHFCLSYVRIHHQKLAEIFHLYTVFAFINTNENWKSANWQRVRGKGEMLKNVPLVLLLKFSMFLIISQMKKKKHGFFAKLLQALAKGVSAYLCYRDWLC